MAVFPDADSGVEFAEFKAFAVREFGTSLLLVERAREQPRPTEDRISKTVRESPMADQWGDLKNCFIYFLKDIGNRSGDR